MKCTDNVSWDYSQAHDPLKGDLTSQPMTQQAASHFLFYMLNLSLRLITPIK